MHLQRLDYSDFMVSPLLKKEKKKKSVHKRREREKREKGKFLKKKRKTEYDIDGKKYILNIYIL